MKYNAWLLHGLMFGANFALLGLMVQQFSSIDTVQKCNNNNNIMNHNIRTQTVLVEDPLDHNNMPHNKNVVSSTRNSTTSNWCVLVCVGANLFEERQHQRENCRTKLYHEAPPGNQTSLRHIFVVGIPSYDTRPVDQHKQGQLATAKEIEIASALLEEQRLHGDLYLTPHRDVYRDLTEKKLSLLKHAVEMGCDYIFKMDHEYCLNLSLARKRIDQHELLHPNEELYLGYYCWHGNEYPEKMAGPHNETTSYFSGHFHVLSRGLASLIVNQDWTHSVLNAAYGTSSEDLNTGHWVHYAAKMHGIQVDWVTAPEILLDVE